jgi:hypothetical protein
MREERLPAQQYLRHLGVFPTGQFVILADRRVVGVMNGYEVVAGGLPPERKGRKRPWHSNLYKEFAGWPTILGIGVCWIGLNFMPGQELKNL